MKPTRTLQYVPCTTRPGVHRPSFVVLCPVFARPHSTAPQPITVLSSAVTSRFPPAVPPPSSPRQSPLPPPALNFRSPPVQPPLSLQTPVRPSTVHHPTITHTPCQAVSPLPPPSPADLHQHQLPALTPPHYYCGVHQLPAARPPRSPSCLLPPLTPHLPTLALSSFLPTCNPVPPRLCYPDAPALCCHLACPTSQVAGRHPPAASPHSPDRKSVV